MRDYQTADRILYAGMTIIALTFALVVYVIVEYENSTEETNAVLCAAKGMTLTTLRQGSDKQTYHRGVCRAPNGQLYTVD